MLFYTSAMMCVLLIIMLSSLSYSDTYVMTGHDIQRHIYDTTFQTIDQKALNVDPETRLMMHHNALQALKKMMLHTYNQPDHTYVIPRKTFNTLNYQAWQIGMYASTLGEKHQNHLDHQKALRGQKAEHERRHTLHASARAQNTYEYQNGVTAGGNGSIFNNKDQAVFDTALDKFVITSRRPKGHLHHHKHPRHHHPHHAPPHKKPHETPLVSSHPVKTTPLPLKKASLPVTKKTPVPPKKQSVKKKSSPIKKMTKSLKSVTKSMNHSVKNTQKAVMHSVKNINHAMKQTTKSVTKSFSTMGKSFKGMGKKITTVFHKKK